MQLRKNSFFIGLSGFYSGSMVIVLWVFFKFIYSLEAQGFPHACFPQPDPKAVPSITTVTM